MDTLPVIWGLIEFPTQTFSYWLSQEEYSGLPEADAVEDLEAGGGRSNPTGDRKAYGRRASREGLSYHDTSVQINPFLCNLWVKTSIVVEFHSSVFIGSSSNGREQWTRLRNKLWLLQQVAFLWGMLSVAGMEGPRDKDWEQFLGVEKCFLVDCQQDNGDLSPTTTRN